MKIPVFSQWISEQWLFWPKRVSITQWSDVTAVEW